LDDDEFDCQFGNRQYLILFDNKIVGLAFRQGKLYMLSMHENVNVVCNDENIVCKENGSSSTNVSTKRKRCDDATSAKLCHCHLGHISRGRIERLIKDDILTPLIQIIASIALKENTLSKLRKVKPSEVRGF
jgi:hypothetical protein